MDALTHTRFELLSKGLFLFIIDHKKPRSFKVVEKLSEKFSADFFSLYGTLNIVLFDK